MLEWVSGGLKLGLLAAHLTELHMAFVKVAQTSDLENNSARLVETGGKSIALICGGGEYFALDNTCTHVGGPLCEGPVTGGTITCPWHAAQFDVKTGKALAGPARGDLACYPVRVEGDGIEIEI